MLESRNSLGPFAQNIHNLLVKKANYIDYSRERPDIIINDDEIIIGIEHCQVDVLFKVKKKEAQSMVGKHRNSAEKLVEKYEDEELLNEDINNCKALSPVLDILKERYDYQDKFDYSKFIDNFHRVTQKHNNNCVDYRNRLKEISDNKPITLACLIDIPYPNVKEYIVKDKKGERRQAIKGLPITKDMLSAIQAMSGFDFVILCLYCFEDFSPKKETICYYFKPGEVMQGVEEQYLKISDSFGLPNAFGLPFKAEVEFPNDMIEKDGDAISFVTRVKRR